MRTPQNLNDIYTKTTSENPPGDTLLEDLESLSNDHIETGSTAGWVFSKLSQHAETSRAYSFVLATNTHRDVGAYLGPLLDLMWEPPNQDPSTLINLGTAIRRLLPDCDPGVSALLGLALPRFTQASFSSTALVAENAIEILLDIESESLIPTVFSKIEKSLLLSLTPPRLTSHSHLEALKSLKAKINQAQTKKRTDFDLSYLLRFQESLTRFSSIGHSSWQHSIQQLIKAYSSRVREWKLLADARISDTQVHQLRIMSATGETPSLSALSRVIQLWQEFIKSLAIQPQHIPTFQPIATTAGSFVVTLAVTSTPSTMKSILTKAQELDSHPVSKTQTDAPPEWFDLHTTLAAEGLHVECSLADTQTEPFRAFLKLAPNEKPKPSPARTKERWKWTLRSIDVPQADRIERVFELVMLVSEGNEPSAGLLHIEPRQVAYYQRAAVSLNLLSETGQLTIAGERLAAIPKNEQYSLAAMLFETSTCGGAWTDWAEATSIADVEPSSAKQFLLDTVQGLNEVTATRRAKTLSTWLRELMPYHYKNSQRKSPP